MSIDAQIKNVTVDENGSGKLNLIDRPGGGNRGQSSLHFTVAPEEVTALNGLNVWGSANNLMLGDIEIAKRVGYTQIVFHDSKTLKQALKAYK